MMIPLNPYVLVALILFAAGYEGVQAVKEPVKHGVHRVVDAAKKVGHGVEHVITLGHK